MQHVQIQNLYPEEVFPLAQVMIELRLPEKELWPNKARVGHWKGKSDAIKSYRKVAFVETRAAMNGSQGWNKAKIHFKFLWPDHRKRDTLNAVSAMKSAVDGMVDAGLIPDDDWKHLDVGSVTSEIDVDNPRVIIVLERLG